MQRIHIYTSIENHHRGGFGDCGSGGTSGLFENANNIGFLWASEQQNRMGVGEGGIVYYRSFGRKNNNIFTISRGFPKYTTHVCMNRCVMYDNITTMYFKGKK